MFKNHCQKAHIAHVQRFWPHPSQDCLHDISFDLNELPFASLSEESFNSVVRTDPFYNESSQCDSDSDHFPWNCPRNKYLTKPDSSAESDLSPIDWFASNINSYYKRNLKIGHLNVNSIYGKADEVMPIRHFFRNRKLRSMVLLTALYLLIRNIALSVEIGKRWWRYASLHSTVYYSPSPSKTRTRRCWIDMFRR